VECQLASRKSRTIAFIIDFGILATIQAFLFLLFFQLIVYKVEEFSGMMITFSALLYLFVTIALTALVFLKDCIAGASPGKRMFGIAVRDRANQDETPSKSRLIGRNISLLLGIIEFIILAAESKKERLGDKLAKTVVIKKKDIRMIRKVLATIVGLLVIPAFIVFLLLGSLTLIIKYTEPSYQLAEQYIINNQEINAEIGEVSGFGFIPSAAKTNYDNGYWDATYILKVKGEKKNTTISIYLTKKPNQKWEVQHYDILE
jgi:uncharacterized RDD family membrane protein YckC